MLPSTPITIWVHGTNLLQILPEPLSGLPLTTFNNFMYCKPGLHPASSLEEKYHHYKIAQALTQTNPTTFPTESIYLFGWSGKLNHAARTQAAQQLLQDIQKLISSHEANHGTKPSLRIITHSHGGNVVLNMAALPELPTDLQIEELVLLACPVQKTTAALIASPVFSKIYSLHSHADMLQIADPQGWPELKEQLKKLTPATLKETIKTTITRFEQERFFSERHFIPQNNLIQARIKMYQRDLLHVEFMMPSFIKFLDPLLQELAPAISTSNDLQVRIDTKKNSIDVLHNG